MKMMRSSAAALPTPVANYSVAADIAAMKLFIMHGFGVEEKPGL